MHIKQNCEGKNLYVSDFGKIIELGKKKGPILNFFSVDDRLPIFTLTINLVLISRVLE